MQVCNDSPMESEIQSHRATLRDVEIEIEIEIPQRVLKQNLPLEPYFANSSQLSLLQSTRALCWNAQAEGSSAK